MKEVEFNLLEEPWIRVLCPDCTIQEVSLTQALLHAQDYTDLAGELPAQDVAVLRLLLAVMHAVFGRVDAEGRPVEITDITSATRQWKELWQKGRLPENPILEYLQKWRDRFWLFHPQHPFWQVPQAKIGTQYSAAKLNGELSESGNKLRLFPAYTGKGKTKMSYAQAARWLLYVNGFDDTSAKPKEKGLPSPGAGWLGKLGLIQAVGKNLFETLLLNLTLLQDGERSWQKETPCWELDMPRCEERTEISQPDNPAELLTLQSRRLLLNREDGEVAGYTLLGGDFFEKTNAFCEQMTTWRAIQEKKNAPIVFYPRRHDPTRQFWREFPTIFDESPSNGKPVHVPGIVRWITLLQKRNMKYRCLNSETMIHFRIVAVGYGDKDFFVTDTFSDELSFHLSLLDELGKWWRIRIAEEIYRCEEVAGAIGILSKELALAAGSHSEVPKTTREQYYFLMDQPFRRWLYSIDPEWDTEEAMENLQQWQNQAQRIARELGQQIVAQAGTGAFIGRSVSDSGAKSKEKASKTYCASPKAYNNFLTRLRKIYRKEGNV